MTKKKYAPRIGKDKEFSLKGLFDESQAKKLIKQIKLEGHTIMKRIRKDGVLIYKGPKMKKKTSLPKKSNPKRYIPAVSLNEIRDIEGLIKNNLPAYGVKNVDKYDYSEYDTVAQEMRKLVDGWYVENHENIGAKGKVSKGDAWGYINDSLSDGVDGILNKYADKIDKRIKRNIGYEKMVKKGLKENWNLDKIRDKTMDFEDQFNTMWHPNDTATDISRLRDKERSKKSKK